METVGQKITSYQSPEGSSIPGPEMRMPNPEWALAANANYVPAITTLTDAIKAPTKEDMSKVADIKQQPEEPVDDFIHRLPEIFDLHGDVTRPDNLGQTSAPWETHLRERYLKGLLPDIAKLSSPTWVVWTRHICLIIAIIILQPFFIIIFMNCNVFVFVQVINTY